MVGILKKYKHIFFNSLRKLFCHAPFEKTICYFSQNCNLDSFIGKLIPENHLYPIDTIRRVKRAEINYILDISDYQNWLIYFGLTNDRPDGLYQLVKKKFIIIDVGANIGQTAMNMAKIAGEDSIILGFEPDFINYSNAIENLQQNKFKNIRYFNIGLGSQTEELPLKINSPLNRGGNRIDRNNDKNSKLIKIERLDDVLKNEQIKHIDLIKIDVEGFELEVLRGAIKTLQQHKPLLYIEIDENNLNQQNTNAKELINFVSELGYNCVNAKSKERIINTNNDLIDCHIDIICS